VGAGCAAAGGTARTHTHTIPEPPQAARSPE